jgi:two-component system sensor histidine kinase KdpD
VGSNPTPAASSGRSRAAAPVTCVVAVALVTAVIALVDDWVPVLSLVVLYILAVLAVALPFGALWATVTSVASMLAFNFVFLPPVHTLTLRDPYNWLSLGVFVVTAVVAGTLAARARQRAAEAEQRERERAVLAEIATELLRGTELERELEHLAGRVAETLGVSRARIELDHGHAGSDEAPYPLGDAGGTLYAPAAEEPSLGARERLLPALGALLAVARERERLAREALEAETLRRSDAAKTAVLRAVSHDLRTPLATIEAALGALESGELELTDDDRAELLETVRIEHARLKRLVDDLLDLSRLQAGAAEPAPELWPASALVEQALDAVSDRRRVDVVIGEDMPLVRVDAVQLQRVIVNLLENALRLSPPGERVAVRVNATRQELLLRVVDHGPGVPVEERERIFEPFHRLDTAGGAGLGLAIARWIVELHGGAIHAEDAEPHGCRPRARDRPRVRGGQRRPVVVESREGQGASFALALPAVPAPVGAGL